MADRRAAVLVSPALSRVVAMSIAPVALSKSFALDTCADVSRQPSSESASVLHVPFVAFGLIFWDAHADQRANKSAHGAADTKACQPSHDGTRSDQGSDPRYGQSTHPGERAPVLRR